MSASYAEEQLNFQLSSLAALPVTSVASATLKVTTEEAAPSPQLQTALHDLSQTKPPTIARLAEILDTVEGQGSALKSTATAAVDRAAEAEILTRATTLIWAHVMQAFVDGALELEDDRSWWEACLGSRSGTIVYFVQSLPKRIFSAATETLSEGKATAASLRTMSVRQVFESLHWPNQASLFRKLHGASPSNLTQQFAGLAFPLLLTRREMVSNQRSLKLARDGAALRVGILATQAPNFTLQARSAQLSIAAEDLVGEASRVYSVLCGVLNVDASKNKSFTAVELMTDDSSEPKSISVSVENLDVAEPPVATAADLRAIVVTYLPRAQGAMSSALTEYGRPSPLVRLWFPFLFLPPALWMATSAIVRNKEWMKEQVSNAKETIKGFFVQWVIEPLEDIAKTMRGGGEGLGVSPETVKSDQESLERMVLSLAKDYYKMSGPSLDSLKDQVESGDLSLVLKAYENEMANPIRNALTGNLIRTLLIQVQKTKTDLSLALERLDQLLRSQQLTFAFVGVAPSVLVLWGVVSWLRGVWSGEHRGKGRTRRYFTGLRHVERILITAPGSKRQAQEGAQLSNRDRGMIIVSVSGLRTWAVGMGSSRRQDFLDDLRMVENPALSRVDKLRVVERMWRCWGVDGRKVVV